METVPPISRILKTLSSRDAEFLKYLDGSFSHTHLALPLQSLNVGSGAEEVTFEIVPVESVHRPGFVRVVSVLIRPQSLILSVGPMLAVLVSLIASGSKLGREQWAIALSSFVGVVLFQIAMNLFNDYGDHIKGRDRMREKGGSRAIQNGWVRATAVRKMAWTLIALAAACGMPAVVLHAAPVMIFAGLAFLFALEIAFQKLRLKVRGWTEVLAFALTGPLLTMGYSWTLAGSTDLSDAVLGGIFGAITLMYLHAVNFENIMTDSQAGVRTWATRAGFDSSKIFFAFTCALTIFFSLVFVLVIEKNLRLMPLVLTQAFFLLPTLMRVRALASPLSSGLVGLRVEALKLALLSTVALVGGFFWILTASRGG